MEAKNIEQQFGFTLIEVLVSLALLAMLCLVLFTTLRFGAATLTRVLVHQGNTDDVTTSEQVLRPWLEEIYPEYIPPPLAGLPGYLDFDGNEHAISFLTSAPLAVAPGGFASMRLSITKVEDAWTLTVSARPQLNSPDMSEYTQETLLTGLSSGDFAYWGADSPGGTNYWHQTWERRGTLPILIRVRIGFPPGDLRHWPDLIISPIVYADQTCEFIQISDSCLGR